MTHPENFILCPKWITFCPLEMQAPHERPLNTAVLAGLQNFSAKGSLSVLVSHCVSTGLLPCSPNTKPLQSAPVTVA